MPILFVTVLIDLVGFGMIIPILPFMAPMLGATKFDIAMLIAIYSIFAGLCGPFWGRLSDHFGRKPILLICLFGGALAYVMLAFATELWMVYASRIFAGVMAGNFGVASAMVADITTPKNRAKGMGLIGAAFGVGFVIGPFLGGVLAGDQVNFVLPSLVAAGLSLLAFIAGWLFLDESLSAEKRAEHAIHRAQNAGQSMLGMLRETGNRLLVLQFFVHNSCISTVSYLFPLWVGSMLSWGPREVGYVFGIQGVVMAILQGSMIGVLVRKLGELVVMLVGVLIMVSGFLLASIASGELMMVSSFFVILTGGTVCIPMLNSLVSKRTPPPQRGRMMGTTTSTSHWGRVFGPLGAGVILSFSDFSHAWMMGGILGLFYISWIVSELVKGKRASAQELGAQ